MSQYYNNPNSPNNRNNRRKARLRKRRRIIRGVSAFIIVFAVTVICLRFLNFGKNKPAGTAPNSDQNIVVEPPTVTTEPKPSEPVNTHAPSPTPEKSAPNPTPAPSAAAASGSFEKLAKPLRIKVSTTKQNVTVYDANNQIIKSFVCSTGLNGADTETPSGTYEVAERGESFFSQTYQEGAYYWTQFYGDYLFHSIPFDSNRELESAEAAKLGTKASHGCVRLSIEDAKWIYDNIPRGTVVVVE